MCAYVYPGPSCSSLCSLMPACTLAASGNTSYCMHASIHRSVYECACIHINTDARERIRSCEHVWLLTRRSTYLSACEFRSLLFRSVDLCFLPRALRRSSGHVHRHMHAYQHTHAQLHTRIYIYLLPCLHIQVFSALAPRSSSHQLTIEALASLVSLSGPQKPTPSLQMLGEVAASRQYQLA